jgi:hypothetical protein
MAARLQGNADRIANGSGRASNEDALGRVGLLYAQGYSPHDHYKLAIE